MDLQLIDPLEHPEWDDLLSASGDPSFFHTSAWARVLVESYEYKPVYFVGLDGHRLSFVMPFMEIKKLLDRSAGRLVAFYGFL